MERRYTKSEKEETISEKCEGIKPEEKSKETLSEDRDDAKSEVLEESKSVKHETMQIEEREETQSEDNKSTKVEIGEELKSEKGEETQLEDNESTKVEV